MDLPGSGQNSMADFLQKDNEPSASINGEEYEMHSAYKFTTDCRLQMTKHLFVLSKPCRLSATLLSPK
jgi:hypothetical protein